MDAPFLNLTPGTRSGIVHDERYAALVTAIRPLEQHLGTLIDEQRRAEEEQASQQLLRAIQRAFREAMLALPPEEYDWFDVQARSRQPSAGRGPQTPHAGDSAASVEEFLGVPEPESTGAVQRQFFDFAGSLFSEVISPAAGTIAVGDSRRFRALPRDRSRRRVEEQLGFAWMIVEGGGSLQGGHDREVEFTAPGAPGLSRLRVTATQREVTCNAEALITTTDSLIPSPGTGVINARGLPGYTLERAAGKLWRSRFNEARNVIVVNSGYLRLAKSVAEAQISGPPAHQGAGVANFHRIAVGSAPRAHGGAVVVYGREAYSLISSVGPVRSALLAQAR